METNEQENLLRSQLQSAAAELIELGKLRKGDLVVVGCSSSEIIGSRMGTNSVPELGDLVYQTLDSAFSPEGIHIAAQCCEHLNRALILERSAAAGYEQVNVVPFPKAGGSFATAAYAHMKDPVAVEEVAADAGLDIGGVMIGMHLKKVAVPLKLTVRKVGEAVLLAARVRPKFVGGERAHYDENLM